MLESIVKKLAAIVPKSQAFLEAEILVEFVSGYSRKDFIISPDLSLSKDQQKKLDMLVKMRIEQRIPVQYLTEQAYFMGEVFKVDKNVLIPRPETEILVEEVMNKTKNLKSPKILDIGTGSGAIAIMLKKNVDCHVCAVDISEAAIDVARYNAKKFDVDIEFAHSNLFSAVSGKFDIIVSNPPYIPLAQKKNIKPEVMNEPSEALFTDDPYGIEMYKKIISQAPAFLSDNAFLYFELGIDQSMPVKNLFAENGFSDIKIVKDLAKIDRIISAKYSYNT